MTQECSVRGLLCFTVQPVGLRECFLENFDGELNSFSLLLSNQYAVLECLNSKNKTRSW